MINWVIRGLGGLFGLGVNAAGAVAGWAWEKVTTGIYTWLANGLALLIEWVWKVLDSASTPRVTDGWFRNGLAHQVGLIALAVVVAMMLASAMQAALAGRPEQVIDALKEGVRAIVASALTLTVVDVLMGVVDEAAAAVWQAGRPDLVRMIEHVITLATTPGTLSTTFIGPLCLLLGFVGLIGLVVALMMRSALLYLVAGLAPLVWSSSVLPMFRPSARKLVHLGVSLVVSKLAIVVTLAISVKLVDNAGSGPATGSVANDSAAAVGTLMSGFVCFIIAAVTPFVLYKLMPTVEGAMVASGIAGGWGRSMTTGAQSALMVKSLGATAGASAATQTVAGQSGVTGRNTGSASAGAGPGPISGMPGPSTGRSARTTGSGSSGGTDGSRSTSATPGPAVTDTSRRTPQTGSHQGGSRATPTASRRRESPAEEAEQ